MGWVREKKESGDSTVSEDKCVSLAGYLGNAGWFVSFLLFSHSATTLCNPMGCSTPGFPVLHHLLELAQTYVQQWLHPTISSSVLPFSSCLLFFPASGSFPMSWLLTSGGQSIGVSASASVLPMNIQEILISYRINWFDLLAVQGTLKSLLQHHSSKASVPQGSAFFMVQLSHPYMTTGKCITLTTWTFVSKVMSQLCNMLSRFVTAFLPRNKCFSIPWLQSPFAVILEPRKIVLHGFQFPIYRPRSDGTRCHDLQFLNVEF